MDWLTMLDPIEALIIAFVVGLFGYLALNILVGVMTEYGEE